MKPLLCLMVLTCSTRAEPWRDEAGALMFAKPGCAVRNAIVVAPRISK